MSGWQAAAPAVVLASGSAARRALLAAAGIAFEARVAAVDEAAVKEAAQAEGMAAADAAVLLAGMKAERVARARPEALVIGCDQVLVCDGVWFDKPGSPAGVGDQLRALRGRRHVLATAVVCMRGGERVWQHVAQPRLTMRALSDGFIAAYVAVEGAAAAGSVGGYRLEGPGVQLFDEVVGEHAAVLGLPLVPLLGFLRQHGVLMA